MTKTQEEGYTTILKYLKETVKSNIELLSLTDLIPLNEVKQDKNGYYIKEKKN